MAYAQEFPTLPAVRIRRVWVWVLPLAAATCMLMYRLPTLHAAASPTPASFQPASPVPAAVQMPSAPQTGWHPATLQSNLDLHFAPSGVLRRPRFVGI